MAKARREKEKESKMEKVTRARMARAFMVSLTKVKEKEKLRMMERDHGLRLKSFKVIAISAGSLVIKRVTAVRRKVVESLMLERKGVRQVEEVPATDGGASAGGGASSSGAVKMISCVPAVDCRDDDESVVDLTVFDNLDGGVFAVRVSQIDDRGESNEQYSCGSSECAYFDLICFGRS